MIPAPLKFFKLIVEELNNFLQNAEAVPDDSDEVRNIILTML